MSLPLSRSRSPNTTASSASTTTPTARASACARTPRPSRPRCALRGWEIAPGPDRRSRRSVGGLALPRLDLFPRPLVRLVVLDPRLALEVRVRQLLYLG